MRGHIIGRHALCVAASFTTLALAPPSAHAGIERAEAPKPVRAKTDKPVRPARTEVPRPVSSDTPKAGRDELPRTDRTDTPKTGWGGLWRVDRADTPKAGRDEWSTIDGVNQDRAAKPAGLASVKPTRAETEGKGKAVSVGVPPATIRIPSLDLGASVVRVGRDEDRIAAPPLSAPGKVGWFEGGPRPGAQGAAVLLGHYDSTTGPAVFYKISELRPGQRIFVTRKDGERLRFVVTKVSTYPKDDFPADKVYGDPGYPALRLITCAGAFNLTTRHYVDNTVVFAKLVHGGETA
ncbi:class F sortase [Nonomuraea sp. bgisy101]|uniref:class F sortase n=1 Tax=Nonomuraea sp. bgisy101 TaxID=3413784 RepID=UPI003D726459